MRLIFLLLFLLVSTPHFAQLGFCEGSKGDPIFHEDFGTGNSPGPPLLPSVTNYSYVLGDPPDGSYTISNNIGQKNGSWHSYLPSSTASNGKALIVNASHTAGQFFRTEISGLCQNTTYEFSAFIMNVYNRSAGVCENGGIPNNIKFQIWDETETILLKEGDTGDLHSTSSPQWKQFALTFQSEAGQESVILKMFNNGEGGCGNDLAIDDIVFRSCGDLTTVTEENSDTTNIQVCQEETPVNLSLQASSDSSVYTDPSYQWQQSSDGTNWTDIPGETNEAFNMANISTSTFFRVKVAEDPANLLHNLCSSASEPFYVEIFSTPQAPISLGDVEICSNQTHPGLKVQIEADESVNWYDAPTGGNLVAEKSNPFLPISSGIYYAQAHKSANTCNPGSRTAVSFTVFEAPEAEDELIYLCKDSSAHLQAGIGNMQYQWSTGASTPSINVSSPGIYSVEIKTSEGCSTTKTIEVVPVQVPVIKEITSEEAAVNILLENSGNFEYSLDGSNFQESGHFPDMSGGIYTAYVQDSEGCEVVTREFAHLVIPSFITPNNDGYNDFFELKGISFFDSFEIRIFDRYGQLLIVETNSYLKWDGTLHGKALPADDYWYDLRIEGFGNFKGNFSLVR